MIAATLDELPELYSRTLLPMITSVSFIATDGRRPPWPCLFVVLLVLGTDTEYLLIKVP